MFLVFANQGKTTYGFGYKLTLTSNTDNAFLIRENDINNGEIKINSIEWYVPQYIPSLEEQVVLSNHIVEKIPTELQYIERSVFMKEVNTQNLWNFELGKKENKNVPIWIFIGFQQ